MLCLIRRFQAVHVVSGALLVLGLTISAATTAQEVNANTNTGGVDVPLAPAPDVDFISKTINTPGARTLIIHYFAECWVPRGHIEYDIVVNKSPLAITARQVPPTHDNTSALCSYDGATMESALHAVSVGTVVACVVTSAGDYTVKVRGHVEGPGAIGPGSVDDQSLVIKEEPFSNGLPECVLKLPGDVAPNP